VINGHGHDLKNTLHVPGFEFPLELRALLRVRDQILINRLLAMMNVVMGVEHRSRVSCIRAENCVAIKYKSGECRTTQLAIKIYSHQVLVKLIINLVHVFRNVLVKRFNVLIFVRVLTKIL
jgi:hypothetical protein